MELAVERIEIENDRAVSITEYHSVSDTRSFTYEILYSEFVQKLQTPKISNMKGSAGCFIAGYVEGERNNKNTKYRSMVTLDIDSQLTIDGVLAGRWLRDNVNHYLRNAYIMYATHNSTIENPRFRLIIPLAKDVAPTICNEIAKYIAEKVLKISVDSASYKTSQPMYYPTCKDIKKFEFYYQDKEMLDPEQLLVEISMPKQNDIDLADPRMKKNWIGAWCNIYSVSDVLKKFLADVYKPVGKNRYSYLNGSTEGGLVVYDNDTFAYSFHASDTISGKCLNSFDLLRLVKFHYLDMQCKPNTPINKLPSFLEMIKICNQDRRVTEFYRINIKGEDIEDGWKKSLEIDSNGKYKNSRFNLLLILENDKNIKDVGRLNEFSDQWEINIMPPWRKEQDNDVQWTNSDQAQLRNYISLNYGIEHNNRLEDCQTALFYKNSYHPIKEYLKGLYWDKKPRVESIFIDFLGAEDNLYSRTVTKKMLVAAIARIFRPGIKFDYVLVMVSGQGMSKSFILSRLAGEWFNESINSFKGDEALRKLQNCWIVELAELSAMKSSEIEEVKAFISTTVDTYRPKYEKSVRKFPRQCVFFGTTNNYEFLKDTTGGRRFWPLTVNIEKRTMNPYVELTNEIIDQIWAEAYQLYLGGEKLYLEDEKVLRTAEELQRQHTSDDGQSGLIQDYLKDKNMVCARQIWSACFKNSNEPTYKDTRKINDIIRKLEGWEGVHTNFGSYGVQHGFRRIQ